MSLRLGDIPLGEHDADWFRVMSACTDSALRVKVASVLGYYVRRRKQEYIEIIQYLAAKHGLEFSECFNKLLNGEELGEPLESFNIDYEIESKIDKAKQDS